jgi:hypothetical protein
MGLRALHVALLLAVSGCGLSVPQLPEVRRPAGPGPPSVHDGLPDLIRYICYGATAVATVAILASAVGLIFVPDKLRVLKALIAAVAVVVVSQALVWFSKNLWLAFGAGVLCLACWLWVHRVQVRKEFAGPAAPSRPRKP